jgi:hypothetical protein
MPMRSDQRRYTGVVKIAQLALAIASIIRSISEFATSLTSAFGSAANAATMSRHSIVAATFQNGAYARNFDTGIVLHGRPSLMLGVAQPDSISNITTLRDGRSRNHGRLPARDPIYAHDSPRVFMSP